MNLPKSVLIVIIHLIPVALLLVTIQALPFLFLLGIPAVAYFSSLLYVGIFKRFEPEEQVQDGENLAPLSFIVEEEQAKQAALEAEAAAKQQNPQKTRQKQMLLKPKIRFDQTVLWQSA